MADAQGAVRYGIYQMTRAIRMAGSGGLYVTQAVLNHSDPQLPGINLVNSADSDPSTTSGRHDRGEHPGPRRSGAPRNGHDRGPRRPVFAAPRLRRRPGQRLPGREQRVRRQRRPWTSRRRPTWAHVNDDPGQRPQFAAIDAYTAGVTAANPMIVIVRPRTSTSTRAAPESPTPQRYPQPLYNVGVITAPTSLGTSQTFGSVDFSYTGGGFRVIEYDTEDPLDSGLDPGYNFPSGIKNPLRAAASSTTSSSSCDNTDAEPPGPRDGHRRGDGVRRGRASPTTSRTCRSPTASTSTATAA